MDKSFKEMEDAEVEVLRQYKFGNLTRLGVANALIKLGFNSDYAVRVANDLDPTDPYVPLSAEIIGRCIGALEDGWTQDMSYPQAVRILEALITDGGTTR